MSDKKPAAKKAPTKTESAKKVSNSGKTAPAKSMDKDPAFDGPLGQAFAAVRTPVYAYVGVNDLAVQAVSGLVKDLRRRAEEAVNDAQSRVTERVVEVQNRVAEVQNRVHDVPERVQALPTEMEELVNRFRPDELRKVADAYVEVAAGIYGGLAARGEDVVTRLREENPQLEAGLARVNEQVARAAGAVEEQVELSEDALGTVARQTRSIGVKAAGRVSKGARKAAEATGDAAGAAADRVDEAADRVDTAAVAAAVQVDDAADKAADKVDETAHAVSDEVQSGAAKVEDGAAQAKKATAKKAPAKKAPAKTAAKPTATTKASTTADKPAAAKSTTAKSAAGDSDAPSPMDLADNDPELTTADTPLPPAGTDRN